MNTSDLIRARHLSRRAVVYIRQSTPNQVLNNHESQRLQYALKQRAVELGWHENDITIIDMDQGISGTFAENREGFQQLVADVALKKIGIVIAYEAQRLARNCTNWYQLLDLCGRADCLIADRDGVYDPASINGRLLLGLKGQISELELHILKGRLTAGILSKAERGELAVRLPTGLMRLPTGEVVKHPDQVVQHRLKLVFDVLIEKKSIAQVVHVLRQRELRIPRRDEFGDIQWGRATTSRISTIVKNPAYAGAFTYGRTRSIRDENTGRIKLIHLPIEDWMVCIHDKYPAYISWAEFEKINAMLRDNYNEYVRRRTRGLPRDGKALLQGIVWCGECGHKMTIQYKGKTHYCCNGLRNAHGDRVCQRLPADPIDEQIVTWLFEALSAAEIDIATQVLSEADKHRATEVASLREEVDRLRYQARLAERQYQHADPENRLVTSELERRWEAALRELRESEERLEQEENTTSCCSIPSDLLESLKEFGPRLPEFWNSGVLRWSQKKSLLRCLVDKVVVQRSEADKVHTRVVWRGGATTATEVPVHVGSFTRLSTAKPMEQEIIRMASDGHSDRDIADSLTSRGYRSPMSGAVLVTTVKRIRLNNRIFANPQTPRIDGYLSVTQLAKALGVSRWWIHHRIRNGTIRAKVDGNTHSYLFPDRPETLQAFRQLLAGDIAHVDF
jgi:DNA invertase Pin-like site-specific DNA recombinase